MVSAELGHLVTEMHCFLRPDSFTHPSCEEIYTGPSGWDEQTNDYVRDESVTEDGEPLTIEDKLRELFPEGVHIVYIGKVYSEATPESMDDCIDIVMSEKRDSLTGGALMQPMQIIQDGFNDFKNAEREFYEKGWPMTHFRGDSDDYDAISDTRSAPAQRVLIKNPVGGADVPLASNFYTEPPMEAPESFVQCMQDYRTTLSQDVTGASPALEGVAGPHDETASQRAMDKAQSMGILGPTWSRVQLVFAGIYKKAALAASKNPDHAKEIVVATGEKQTVTIQLEKLTRGSFHCKPAADSTFPESTAAKRANLGAMLPQIAASPVGVEFFNSPDNWATVLNLQGFPELTLTPALAYRKQMRELEILTRESPTPNQPAVEAYNQQHAKETLAAVTAGLPEPPYAPPDAELPSIIPSKRDYHKWELAKCQEWLSSEDCWRIEVEGQKMQAGEPPQPPKQVPPGYSENDHVRNVQLHADWHEKMLAEQQAAITPMMPMPTPPQGSGPKPTVPAIAQPPGAPGQPTL